MNFRVLLVLAGIAASSAENNIPNSNSYAQGQNSDNENVLGSTCQTRRGEDGVCATFRSCYPVIAGFEPTNSTDDSNQLLIDVLESTTSCIRRDAGAPRNTDDVVCCTTINGRPPSDVTIVQALDTGVEEGSETLPVPPLLDNSCVSSKVVDIHGDIFTGNVTAPRGAFPFMAALTSKNRQFCGGSIIDNYHILTAAHCVAHIQTPEQVSRIRIVVGAVNYKKADPDKKIYEVGSIMMHGNYSDQTISNDIALIRLAKPIEFTRYIMPICMNKADDYSDGKQMATLAGWGKTGFIFGPPSEDLRYVHMRVWNNTECKNTYGDLAGSTVPDILPTMVCAGSELKDACQGDSGGPLFMKRGQNKFYEQIGVVSWGVGCGAYPAVYTRVDRYQDWVEENRNRNLKIAAEEPLIPGTNAQQTN